MIQKLIPLIFILAAIGLFFIYTTPTYTGPVKETELQLSGMKGALAAATTFKQKEKRLMEQRSTISDDNVRRLQSFLPDGVDNVRLILDINHAADVSGIQLANFDVKSGVSDTAPAASPAGATAAPAPSGAIPLQSTSPVDSLDLSVQATGTYSAFRTFLSAAEHSLRPLDLMSMTLISADKGVYTYGLTFRIYWLH